MDQVQVLSAVCKKLNSDIEALGTQTSMRESALMKLSGNQQAFDEQLRQLNMDLQMKLTRTDTVVQKLQTDVEQMSHGLRDVMNSQQEANRSNLQRYQEIKVEISSLSQRVERMFNEQQMLLRTFETDTARALSTADSRSHAFVDELRNQILQSKTQEDAERERAEQKTTQKIEEIKRALDKYERLDKRIEDAIHHFERKSTSLEDQCRRAISDLTRNNEGAEKSVYKKFDEKYQRTMASLEKMKKEMRGCFESLEGSVETLQRITEGRIKVTEEKLDKEIEKLRSMTVLI